MAGCGKTRPAARGSEACPRSLDPAGKSARATRSQAVCNTVVLAAGRGAPAPAPKPPPRVGGQVLPRGTSTSECTVIYPLNPRGNVPGRRVSPMRLPKQEPVGGIQRRR